MGGGRGAAELGIDEARARELMLAVLKVAVVWLLEAVDTHTHTHTNAHTHTLTTHYTSHTTHHTPHTERVLFIGT